VDTWEAQIKIMIDQSQILYTQNSELQSLWCEKTSRTRVCGVQKHPEPEFVVCKQLTVRSEKKHVRELDMG
jgi:hypothetical protein